MIGAGDEFDTGKVIVRRDAPNLRTPNRIAFPRVWVEGIGEEGGGAGQGLGLRERTMEEVGEVE